MRELKTALYADKFATFFMLPESFCRSFVLQMSLIHSTIGETQVDLRDLEKHNAELLILFLRLLSLKQ